MMPIGRLERHLPQVLEELAEPQMPDYFADLMWTTAHSSQRPAWSMLERWIPVNEIALRPVLAQRLPWRPVFVLGLVMLTILAGLVFAAGAYRLPPAFGPAGNGLIVHSEDGDIYTFDPRTGASNAIVTGPDADVDPSFSSDGTKILFERLLSGDPSQGLLYVANVDGSRLQKVSPDALTDLNGVDLSPDGQHIAMVASLNEIPSLFTVPSDGGQIRPIRTGQTIWGASFRPTGPADILFGGSEGYDGSYSGLYLIAADGSNLRTLVAPRIDADLFGDPRWSPDGSQIAYGRREPSKPAIRLHVMSADGTDDHVVGQLDGAWAEGWPRWSPDGTKLLVERRGGDAWDWERAWQPAVISLDGAPAVPIAFEATSWVEMDWSPDGKSILATPTDADGKALPQLLWDPLTGESTTAPWPPTSPPSWQRIAP